MVPQLMLAKRIFLEAGRYVDLTDPVAAGMAISMLQDAAELYIWTLMKQRGITPQGQGGFVANLDALKKAGIAIPHVAKLDELNKARVGFKHYGNLPDHKEAQKHQTYVEDFLRDAMQDHFGVKFDDLSLVDLVADQEIRDQLRSAEANIAAGKFEEAAVDLAKARTITFGKMQKYLPPVDRNLRDGDQVLNAAGGRSTIFAYLTDYLTTLREASLVAMLQLSIEDYAFLRTSLPSAARMMAGNWSVTRTVRTTYNEAVCRKALSNLVTICQRLQSRA